MRVAITIGTPKHAHIWRYAAPALRARGHQTLLLRRDYRETLAVAGGIGVEGPVFGRCVGAGLRRSLEYPAHVLGHYRIARDFRPDILAGYGVYESHSGRLLGKPAIGWNDTEHAPGQNALIRQLSTCVCVPSSFSGEVFGRKQLRISGYLESAYLHPNRYTPNDDVLKTLGVSQGEKYALVRLNAMDATHDVGAAGFTDAERRALIRRLERHGRVFISPEASLPDDLQKYVLPTPKHLIHDVLAHASLYVGDSGTMQNEAAILGTPSIRYTTIPEHLDRGNSAELEMKFGLMENVRDPTRTAERAEAIFSDVDPTERNAEKVNHMLKTQIDVTAFIVWFLENYPDSESMMRENPERAQAPFRDNQDWLSL